MTHQEASAKLRMDMQLRGMAKSGKISMRCDPKNLEALYEPFEEMEGSDLSAYMEYLNNQSTLSLATVNTYNSALRFFFGVTL